MVCSYGGTQGDYNISLRVLCAIKLEWCWLGNEATKLDGVTIGSL